MSKNKKTQALESAITTELGRGKIKDNFFAALVTSKVYKLQVVKLKKGRGHLNATTSTKVKNLI